MGNGQYKDGKYIAYNDLYDPLMCRSVCITGQLFLIELANHLVQTCPTLKIIQLNTDGIMVSFDESDRGVYESISKEWQERTGFELEVETLKKVVQRDVNNYLEVKEDGSVKAKGGVLVRGIAEAGAFKVNNDACIIAKAVKDFYVDGTPSSETIGACDDPFQFQLIAKAGRTYKQVYHVTYKVESEVQLGDVTMPILGAEIMTPVQRVNRVYASKDMADGKLVKLHSTQGNYQNIASLPDHCLIDNDNEVTMDQIDKTWYVREAERLIREFQGVKEKKRNTRKVNATKKKVLNLIK